MGYHLKLWEGCSCICSGATPRRFFRVQDVFIKIKNELKNINLHNIEGNLMKKICVSISVLIIVVIAATSSIIIAQAGSVSDSSTYKSCVDDSECGEDGYCDDGKCIKSGEKKGCVNDSECGEDGYCDDGKCIKSGEKKGCVDDSECGDNEYCDDGKCQQTKRW